MKSDDYLWDRSGEPDREVEHLERLLSSMREELPAPDFPSAVGEARATAADWWPRPVRPAPPRPVGRPLVAWRPAFAAVAALAVIACAAWLAWRAAGGGWQVERLAGTPRIGWRSVGGNATLAVGQWLTTDASSRAKIAVGWIGEVEVRPNTRIRLVRARPTDHRLALQRGAVEATIWSRPRLFFIETPAGVAVDLGCSYVLQVDEAGAGKLRVTSGWVAFERGGRESVVPAGAVCVTRPRVGPGTPYFEDARGPFRLALARLDFEPLDPLRRRAALDSVLVEARERDAFTLWHLLGRVGSGDRELVYRRLAALVPPPAGVTREGILRGDRGMLDRWWNAFGLGETTWWRMWEGKWPIRSR